MPERLVSQRPRDRVPRYALRPAPPTPRVVVHDSALDHRPIHVEVLADGLEAELIEAAERGEAGRGEGSVEHVEVFRMVSVGTSILGGPRPLSSQRRPTPDYTLNCEEPAY